MEDIRLALPENSFAETVQLSFDKLDETIDDEIIVPDNWSNDNDEITPKETNITDSSEPNKKLYISEYADFSGSGSPQQSIKPALEKGDQVEVFWSLDDMFYSGMVKTIHKNGEITILYDDGVKERLDMEKEKWNYSRNTTTANSGAMSDGKDRSEHEVTDIAHLELNRMFQFFGNKPFLKFQAQGFEQFLLQAAYKDEEQSFLKTVEVISRKIFQKTQTLYVATQYTKSKLTMLQP